MSRNQTLAGRKPGALLVAAVFLTVALDLGALACSSQQVQRDEPESTAAERRELDASGNPAVAGVSAKPDAAKQEHYSLRERALLDAVPMALSRMSAAPPLVTEQYDFVVEKGFVDVVRSPLSTFSIDVDTASYANVRRMLREGRMPPTGAVRIEEMVNYFSYDYPDASGDEPFSLTVETTTAPWAPRHQLVRIGLQGRRIDERDVPPRNLTFLLDVSGSMASPDKLGLVKRAMAGLAGTLRPEDRVAIVVYAGASGLVLPPTSGEDRGAILAALEQLGAGGSTAGAAGIRLAYEVARRSYDPRGINRVILATDGDFNVGISNRSDLVELIEHERESGVFLTVLGVGRGNLKDATMEQLADHGNGNYAYLDSLAEARKVLVEEAGGTLVTIAKDVKIQVEFNPAHVSAWRLIGYDNRLLADRDFNDDTKDAGEIGAGHDVTALYEVVPVGVAPPGGDVDDLRYQTPRRTAGAGNDGELLTVKLRYKQPDGRRSRLLAQTVPAEVTPWRFASDDLRFAASVAAFGMLLRESEHAGEASWEQIDAIARSTLARDPGGRRAEFVTLVGTARELAKAEIAHR
jgi:Ca-activated chloride channel family protein